MRRRYGRIMEPARRALSVRRWKAVSGPSSGTAVNAVDQHSWIGVAELRHLAPHDGKRLRIRGCCAGTIEICATGVLRVSHHDRCVTRTHPGTPAADLAWADTVQAARKILADLLADKPQKWL